MALFPVNQNVQWFTPSSGDITALKTAASGLDNRIKKASGKVWFYAQSGKNTQRSAVIEIANSGYVKYVAAADMKHIAKCVKITMNSSVNSGNPVNGKVYGIYINQRNYHALGDNEFMELGAEVRYGSQVDLGNGAETIDSADDLLNALALTFVRNLGSDNDMYRVVVATANNANAYEVAADTDLHSTSTKALYILEKEQDWLQGTMQRESVNLKKEIMHQSTVVINTVEHDDWATIEDYAFDLTKTATSNYIEKALTNASPAIPFNWSNSKDVADMEWFYLGEHGDQMRLMGYPNVNPAQLGAGYYNVNSASTDGYDLIYIHHAYVGSNHAVQKSEQDVIIAVPYYVDTTGSNTYSDGNLIADKLAIALEAIPSGHVASKTVYNF